MYFNDEEKAMLLSLFRLYGPSNGEKPILDFIVNILQANNIPFAQDDKGFSLSKEREIKFRVRHHNELIVKSSYHLNDFKT